MRCTKETPAGTGGLIAATEPERKTPPGQSAGLSDEQYASSKSAAPDCAIAVAPVQRDGWDDLRRSIDKLLAAVDRLERRVLGGESDTW
ncbi:MAG: hypothetical protein NZ694_11830 [Tepidimonas sp.]|nr:hypothetical protein [Tepidimonas sp.]